MSNLVPEEIPENLKDDLNNRIRPKLYELIDAVLDDNSAKTIKDSLILWVGENRKRSALLSENMKPSKNYPNGAILLHIDAIVFCAKAIGDHEISCIANALFHEIARWFKLKSKGYEYIINDKDEDRAESVSKKLCKKLYNKRLLPAIPKDIRRDEEIATSYLLWLKEWTKMSPQEWHKYISGREK